MTKKTGRFAIIEQFLADGMKYMFGNPGTVEQGFLDALSEYPDMQYIQTLQESVAVLIGDGYARATQKPTLIQIHSTPGLGNSIGAIYQAMRGHSPLVVIGGDAGLKYMPMEAQMYGDLVSFAKPVTKWSTIVTDAASLLRTIRRAIKIAATPPMGPVYICLPADILDKPCVEKIIPTSIPSTRIIPDDNFIKEVSSLLANAKKPMIYIGDGIAYSDAQEELSNLAHLLGAEVWGGDSGELNISHTHPMYMGELGHMFGAHSLPITQRGDVNLICGTYMVPEVFPELGTIFSEDSKNIHIDLAPDNIAKNHPVNLSAVCDPKLTLAKLIETVELIISSEQKTEAKNRFTDLKSAKEEILQLQKETDLKDRDIFSMTTALFMKKLALHLPEDAIIFDEALTCSPELLRYIPPTKAGHFFQTRGGSLGVGIPGAIGVNLAHPDKTVLGFTGDGGSMYTIQSLWTAAKYNSNAKFIICNNGCYHLLQLNIEAYWKELDIVKHEYPSCFDISSPPVNFTKLSESMGVKARRVKTPKEIDSAIEEMMAYNGPFLLDLELTANQGAIKKRGKHNA